MGKQRARLTSIRAVDGIYIDMVLYITKLHIQEATILSVISV
jgi:hypothetical protein